ncbi:MAG: SurA N-terminal domain-containing protein [Bacteroidia bacterium]|nr:SurA N-terminal domain-containing protein [Bacteroidia bacterium]
MAIIQKIQQKTGCLFLLILCALLIFVISDLIRTERGGIFGNNSLNVGEIRGEKVSYEEFNVRLNNMLDQLAQNNPDMKIDENVKSQYSEQAWNSFLQDKIFKVEYEKLGIQVSSDELADMTIGDHPDEQIVKAFTPEGGQFDKNRLIKFLQEDIAADENKNRQWIQFEEGLIQNTMGKKYAAIVKGAAYTTKIEAKNQFADNNDKAMGSFVGIQYATIPDASIKISEDELKTELEKNKAKYKQEASRDIEFVSFSILPTSEDSAVTKTWAYENYEKLKIAKYDSVFINIMNSENPWDGAFKRVGSFDNTIEPQLFALDSGQMLGPLYKDGKYSIYKISKVRKDTAAIFKASHILVPLNGRTAADSINAQNRLNSILGEMKSGKLTFDQAALPNADGSGQVQGDLGYISPSSTSVSKKFYETALRAPEGQLFVVADESGLHIGKVTSPKSTKIIQVAILSQSITSGRNTIRNASEKANDFLTVARNAKDFGKVAESKGLSKRVAFGIKETDMTISGVTEPKQVIRWLYDKETEEGTVSDMMSFEGSFMVIRCSKVKEEGTPKVSDIKTELELAVRNRKKAEKLEKKFRKALEKSKTMEQLASNVGSVQMLIPEQLFGNDNIPGVGYDLKVLGTFFGISKNKFSPVIRGENGIYVVWLSNINKPQRPAKWTDLQKGSLEQLRMEADAGVMDALRKNAKIKDERYKYF